MSKLRVAKLGLWKPDRFAYALIGICLAGLALRVLYVLTFTSHLHFGLDAVWYELVAGTVADGKGFVDPAKFYGHGVVVPTAFRPPLYPLFLAAIAKTLGGSRTTYQLAGCGIGTATVGLIGQLGKRVGGAAVGLTAAALAAISPALLGIDASVMAETIYVPLVALTLLALFRAIERPTARRWVLAGALGGAATLARSDGGLVVVLVVLPVAFVHSARRARPRLGAVGAALLGALIVVTPWIVRNQMELRRPTLATLDAGTAIAGTNCDSTYYGSKLGSWDYACTRIAGQDAMSELQLTDALQHRGLHYATTHAERLPLVVAARVAREWGLWNPTTEARIEAVESRNSHWQLITWAFDTMLLGLALYGMLIRRHCATLLPLVLLVAAVTFDAALVYGKQRFQAAAHPAVLVIAALVIVALARRKRCSREASLTLNEPHDEGSTT
jgi:4-amino-4-deoxy-L-arabinose transferase-like glycosyltransferase